MKKLLILLTLLAATLQVYTLYAQSQSDDVIVITTLEKGE